jgi:7-keto-8-aminopelargonate synthetase-like enzyme
MSDLHRFRNNAKAIGMGNPVWDEALHHGLIDLQVSVDGQDRVRGADGHRFVNLCSCSYLGLHNHPAILEGAIEMVRREGVIDLPIARVRIRLRVLDELESALSDLYGTRTLSALSASAATSSLLPLLASGHLCDDGEPRVLVFDKLCHFSMNLVKPICADESPVLTCRHNDLDFIEDACKKHGRVAYIAEGVYSMGGYAPVRELLELQDRYGLFLYFDDSHSLSVVGESGEGYVKSCIPGELNPLTVIVASCGKGFGGSGGVVMLGPKNQEPLIHRFGGPMAWSQGLNIPSIGVNLAAIQIHRSPELGERQRRLQENLALFDSRIDTEERGNGFPVKIVRVGGTNDADRAVEVSKELFRRGFYSSAVFFPIVEKGKAGLRVMVRADNRPEDLTEFCDLVEEVIAEITEIAAGAEKVNV